MKQFVILLMLLAESVIFAANVLTRQTDDGLAAAGNSTGPVLTSDGRHVVFSSDAFNLLSNVVGNGWVQLYRRDLISSNVTLVTRNGENLPVNGNCAYAACSSNAQFVAFISDATDIVPGTSRDHVNLYLRDVEAGTTAVVSPPPDGANPQYVGNLRVENVLMSEDGEWVFFDSTALNLVIDSGKFNSFDVFAYHRPSGTNVVLVKSTTNSAAWPARGARLLSITPDGRRVAFLLSPASEFAPGATNTGGDVFVLDRNTGTTSWASPLEPFFGQTYRCLSAQLSRDGAYVAVTASSGSNGPTMLFRHDLVGGTTDVISTNVSATSPGQISSNGQFVTFGDGTNVYRWNATTGTAEMANVTTNNVVPGTGRSINPRSSLDGNLVCFVSNSPDLTASNIGGVFQIYCRDFAGGVTRLVTRTEVGGNKVPQPSARSSQFSAFDVSSDGLVVFDSSASDLARSDFNGASDIFAQTMGGSPVLLSRRAGDVRSTALGNTVVTASALSSNGAALAYAAWSVSTGLLKGNLSTLPNGAAYSFPVSGGILSLAASGDGRYVAVYTAGSADESRTIRINRFDRVSGSLIPVDQWQSNGGKSVPAISEDGNLIAYSGATGGLNVYDIAAGASDFAWSLATQPLAGRDALISTDGRFVVWYGRTNNYEKGLSIHDRSTRTTDHVTGFGDAAISLNSRYLAFFDGFVPGSVRRRDLVTKATEAVGPALTGISISADGRFIVGIPLIAGVGTNTQVVVIDCAAKQNFVISLGRNGEIGNGRSRAATISSDGRYVAYVTDATNIVEGNLPHVQQVVLRDMIMGATTILSTSTNGGLGNANSSAPHFSADGRTLVFESMASNLTPGDYNNARDIFVVRLNNPDNDGDGVDDGWEINYFGDLSHSGDEDIDGDGVTEREEFLAGTNPADNGSLFRVITMSRVGAPGQTIMWTGNPAMPYRVEYKGNLNDTAWTPLNSPVTWTGETARCDDATAVPTRFYRVVRLP